MTGHIVTTWLLTYAAHGALFAALAAVAERTRWGAVASPRDAFWKLARVGGLVTFAPFWAHKSASPKIRVVLAGVLALALTPLVMTKIETPPAVTGDRRTRSISGQLQRGRQSCESCAPVIQLLLQHLALQPASLPECVIGILHWQFG